MNEQNYEILTHDMAIKIRNVVSPIIKQIEWGMRYKHKKFLESGTWDMPFAFDEDAKKRWDSLTDEERELAYEWLETMLKEKGWTLSFDKLHIIPFDSEKNLPT